MLSYLLLIFPKISEGDTPYGKFGIIHLAMLQTISKNKTFYILKGIFINFNLAVPSGILSGEASLDVFKKSHQGNRLGLHHKNWQNFVISSFMNCSTRSNRKRPQEIPPNYRRRSSVN